MREWRQDRLDEMLDDALASYGKAPEREGLERRVLAKVNERTMPARPSGRFVLAMGAAAAAACCLVWWEMPKMTMHPSPAATTTTTPKTSKTEEALLAKTIPARDPTVVLSRPAKLRSRPKRSAEPKLPQFPTPSPMTGEERALLRLATGDTKAIPRELTHSGDPIEPLRMAAIEIKPLE